MPKHAAPNWSELLKQMREVGMTQAEIAEAVEMSQANVSDLLSGKVKKTEYSRGLKILAAHRLAMRRKPAAEAA